MYFTRLFSSSFLLAFVCRGDQYSMRRWSLRKDGIDATDQRLQAVFCGTSPATELPGWTPVCGQGGPLARPVRSSVLTALASSPGSNLRDCDRGTTSTSLHCLCRCGLVYSACCACLQSFRAALAPRNSSSQFTGG